MMMVLSGSGGGGGVGRAADTLLIMLWSLLEKAVTKGL
jgi:hypothetical protein